MNNEDGQSPVPVSVQGQSLMEVIVAATVGILVVSALTFATIFSLRNANFAKNSSQATKLAQEGIERVRTGRDRNQCINGLGVSGETYSWNGGNSSCGNPVNPIWSYTISSSSCTPDCYFNVNSAGVLQNIGTTLSLAESIAPNFKRAVILSDDSADTKKVTVIVTWNDTTGPHESKLATILGKL